MATFSEKLCFLVDYLEDLESVAMEKAFGDPHRFGGQFLKRGCGLEGSSECGPVGDCAVDEDGLFCPLRGEFLPEHQQLGGQLDTGDTGQHKRCGAFRGQS